MARTLPPPREPETSYQHGPASESFFNYGRSWMVLLLAGHILTSSCLVLTDADNATISVMPKPWLPLEGTEVTIVPEGNMVDVFACCWFRKKMANDSLIFIYEPPPESKYHYGKGFTGRESIGWQCSLHITRLTLHDEDLYLIHKQRYEELTSEYGDVFLMIRHKEVKEEEEEPPKQLEATDLIRLGLIVGCIVGLSLLVGLVAYQTSTHSSTGKSYAVSQSQYGNQVSSQDLVGCQDSRRPKTDRSK